MANLMVRQLSAEAKRGAEMDEVVAGIIAALAQIGACQDVERMRSKIQVLTMALNNGERSRENLISAVVSAK